MKNLGVNNSRKKDEYYDYIEKKFGMKKKCGRNGKNKYGLYHSGVNPVPVREFALMLKECIFDKEGNIIECNKVPLQGACRKCDSEYRRARLDQYRNIYEKMSEEEIYVNYKKTYGNRFRCSVCDQWKEPEEFSISIGMETGLHNQCKTCSKKYSEAVGSRWVIYSPEGRNRVKIKKEDSFKNPSKDHIWPLSKGGSDYKENIVFMERTENSSKSNSIPDEIKNPSDINKKMISKRYHPLLDTAILENWSIEKFDSKIEKSVQELIYKKSLLNDSELKEFFEKEKRDNNTKHDTSRAVRKFREYYKNKKKERLL